MRDHPPRTVIDGRYDVESRVGSGGFSTVWRASDRDGGPDVAVKFPKAASESVNDTSQVREHFEREYRTYDEFAGSVLPRSVGRFVAGRRADPAYVGMEYVPGTELGDHVSGSGAWPGVEAARRYGFPVIRALEFLHANGYCYLDCKPANVVVDRRTDRPVLVDFNTVAAVADADETLFHEDPYKAPEQTPDDRHDAAAAGPPSDVYAGGKLLCYLLSGAAFDTSDMPSDGVDPRAHGTDCSRALAEVVERATKTEPGARYDTAHELLVALYEATGRDARTARLTDRGGVVCPIRPGETLGRFADGDPDPDVTVSDRRRHVSPVHCAFRYDASWLVEDASLNGTYVNVDGEWVLLLSDGDGETYTSARIPDEAEISPVDPDYAIDLHLRTDG